MVGNELVEEFMQKGLVYRTNDGNFAYNKWAFFLDKFALSYGDDKYRYNGECDFVPTINEYPEKYHTLIATYNDGILDLKG